MSRRRRGHRGCAARGVGGRDPCWRPASWRLGTGPFLDGAAHGRRRGAGRWRAADRGADHGVLRLALAPGGARASASRCRCAAAVAAYYRSQFLNTDAARRRARRRAPRRPARPRAPATSGAGCGRSAWERVAGQVVQVVLAVVVLLAAAVAGALGDAAVAGASLAVLVAAVRAGPALLARSGPSRPARAGAPRRRPARRRCSPGAPGPASCSPRSLARRRSRRDVPASPPGPPASTRRRRELVPLALLVLLAMAVPANVAGWGPREGVAAWAFGAAGLGAAQGVATAVVYGVHGARRQPARRGRAACVGWPRRHRAGRSPQPVPARSARGRCRRG